MGVCRQVLLVLCYTREHNREGARAGRLCICRNAIVFAS